MRRISLKDLYRDSFYFIKESRKFIFYTIFIFILFFLVGFFFPTPEFVSLYLADYINSLLEKTKNFGFFDMATFIFLNNLKSSFFGLVFGIFIGIFPIFSSLGNGYVLGFVSKVTVFENGFFVLWRIFPHGIFELCAVFISLGMGLKLGFSLFKKSSRGKLRTYFNKSLITFFLIVFPLLVIAAIIESLLIFFV